MGNRKLLAIILIAIAAVLVGLGVTAAIKRQPVATTAEDELVDEAIEPDTGDELLIEDDAALESDETATDEDVPVDAADEEDFAPVNEAVEE